MAGYISVYEQEMQRGQARSVFNGSDFHLSVLVTREKDRL
jgi:hypothetical protein